VSKTSPQRQVVEVYRRQAKGYDASGIAALKAWRRKAVERLSLRRGDVAVDIGCGTGLNFALLHEVVGPEGRIIGVDLTDAMLNYARQRVAERGWRNVELVQSDAAQYVFPARVDGMLATFALTFVPDIAQVIHNCCQALTPGRRCVVLDMAWPAGWPFWLRHGLFFLAAYGITDNVIRRAPWQAVWRTMTQQLADVRLTLFWLGFFYLVSGRKPDTD
jgi:demethylmenaquinone methyltransferase/2-methoxy-6-polyprenyl-1,4-benzoquinol methylase